MVNVPVLRSCFIDYFYKFQVWRLPYHEIPVIKDEKVKEYLQPILTSEPSQEAYLKKNGKVYKYKEKVVHITGYAP